MGNRRLIIEAITGLAVFLVGVVIAAAGSVAAASIGVLVAVVGAAVLGRIVRFTADRGWTGAVLAGVVLWAAIIAVVVVLPSWWVWMVRPSGWVKDVTVLGYYLVIGAIGYGVLRSPKPRPAGPKGVSAYGRPLVGGES